MKMLDPKKWNGWPIREKKFDEEKIKDITRKLNAGEDIPPITIFWWIDKLKLEDGEHRFEACKRLGVLCPYKEVKYNLREHLPKHYKGKIPYRPKQKKSNRKPKKPAWRLREQELAEKRKARGKKLKKEQDNGN